MVIKIMRDTNNEWWRWELNRKVAEYLSKPTPEQEAMLSFLLTSYRALHENQTAGSINCADSSHQLPAQY
jgi:hypothetical protein